MTCFPTFYPSVMNIAFLFSYTNLVLSTINCHNSQRCRVQKPAGVLHYIVRPTYKIHCNKLVSSVEQVYMCLYFGFLSHW